MIVIGVIIALNILDILNTLYIINAGGVEVNPFMDYFLAKDVWLFVGVKMFITSLALLTLVKYRATLIKYILILYVTLVTYQYYIILILIGV